MQFHSERTFNWLFSRDMNEVKELSRVILACHLWGVSTELVHELIGLKKEGCWEGSLRDTSRAASALAARNIVFRDVVDWMLSEQKHGAWGNDVYDTTYALAALADMGVRNREGCSWLVDNYGPAWEHPGTTALVITALIKQGMLGKKGGNDNSDPGGFIAERAVWMLSKRAEKGGWKNPATSNIVMQALILAGHGSEIRIDVQWLLDNMNPNGSWGEDEGDVNTTALTLITLAYLEKKLSPSFWQEGIYGW
ncbi:MAG: hypothetical protein JW705_06590 [Methanosarcinaceae archaeon]|nr:hypothetical protein [Methanosarcinaceae archaeon]